jgi:Hint module
VTQRLVAECVKTCADIRNRVKDCGRLASQWPPCSVKVCKNKKIKCPRRKRAIGYDPIDLTNKSIEFECEGDCPTDTCVIDGDGDNQLFNGTYVSVRFTRINFINSVGGAIRITRDKRQSQLNFSDCSFINNSASSGSALAVQRTELRIDGSSTGFINNRGNGPPLEIFSSTANIWSAKFMGNNVTDYGSAVLAFNSEITFGRDVSFIKSNSSRRRNLAIATADNDCDVFVAVYEDNLKRNASCLKSDTIEVGGTRSNIAECPAPVPVPIPTPGPPCFSGWNTIEVQDIGIIRMDQLKIGDYIRSGNGQFTQVYGFAHLDRNLEAPFLQFFVEKNRPNETGAFLSSGPLEVSAQHLLLLNNDQLIKPIRASDVAVGDWLNGHQVQRIEKVIRRGVYAPLTFSGDLMVNEVCGSNYVAVLDHDWIWNQHSIGHLLYLPHRTFCSFFLEACKEEKYINGYGYIAYLAVHVGSMINHVESYYVVIYLVFIPISCAAIGMLGWLLLQQTAANSYEKV